MFEDIEIEETFTRPRAATEGKAAKVWSLAGFCEIENGGGVLVKWPPLWHPCLPKIYHGSPEHDIWKTF